MTQIRAKQSRPKNQYSYILVIQISALTLDLWNLKLHRHPSNSFFNFQTPIPYTTGVAKRKSSLKHSLHSFCNNIETLLDWSTFRTHNELQFNFFAIFSSSPNSRNLRPQAKHPFNPRYVIYLRYNQVFRMHSHCRKTWALCANKIF